MKTALDRKARNLKRARNFFRTVGLTGLGLGLYAGVTSANLEKPEGHEKYHNLKSRIETIETIQDKHEKLDESKVYSPSLEKIKNSYEKSSKFYEQGKGDIEDKIKNMDTYEIRRYDEKKDKYGNLLGIGAGIFVLGIIGAAEFGGNYRFRKSYLKEEQKEERKKSQ